MPTGCTFNPCVTSLKIQMIRLKKKKPMNAIQIHIHSWKVKIQRPCFIHTKEIQSFCSPNISCHGQGTALASTTMICWVHATCWVKFSDGFSSNSYSITLWNENCYCILFEHRETRAADNERLALMSWYLNLGSLRSLSLCCIPSYVIGAKGKKQKQDKLPTLKELIFKYKV